MKIKTNYIVIPLVTIAVAVFGGYFSNLGMEWYELNIIKPDLVPPTIAFPIAWNLIFILSTISALILINKGKDETRMLWFLTKKDAQRRLNWIMALFIINAVLNVGWSLLFFTFHLILPAYIEMILLEVTLIALFLLGWKISKPASLLLIPYFAWVAFATYLTYQIYILN